MKKLFGILFFSFCCLLPCSMTVLAEESNENVIYETLEDLEGKKIAILSGTTFDQIAYDTWENPEIIYVQNVGDGILALQTDKVDALVSDGPYAQYLISQNDDLTYIDEALTTQDLAIALPKSEEGEALKEEMDSFITTMKEDGTLDDLMDLWFDASSEKPDLNLSELSGDKGTLRLGIDSTNAPFEYLVDDTYEGYEIDILYRFCKEAGYGLEISDMSFDSLIPSLTTGKMDVIACAFGITEERKESVLFTEPICENKVVVIISKDHAAEASEEEEDMGFVASVKSSFTKTFITENRWKLFLQGIGMTLSITFFSLILGTLLGFLLYMWVWTGQKAAKAFTGFYVWFMSRMPMVVLLLILFYVIFAKSSLSGAVISVIGFTLVFGGTMLGLIQGGVAAVDPGQMEAGLALGYTRMRTFFRIILPQAVRHFLPGYKGEVVSLIKSTAIVGYVTVQDLTKVGDIVRSRTFEAFFPLVATAFIYLILAELLILLVTMIEKAAFPARRTETQILKGVKTND